VNLIGEHTDYNDGFVLPCAIDFATLVAARPRADRRVRVLAVDRLGVTGVAHADEFALDTRITRRDEAADWPDYVRGMVAESQAAGALPRGADLAIAGNVPSGAGLSSSAALEVSVGRALLALDRVPAIDPTRLARLAQRAENDFVGCRCGIMDQLISARGVAGHALLIDCRSLDATAVPMPPDLAVLILHSNVRRGLVDSEYNRRRLECEAAARHFGVPALRDVDEAMLAERSGGLDDAARRRARHVVTENRRTLDAAQALRRCDRRALSALMAASQASMRDDFEITVPAIDTLVEIVAGVLGDEGGVRMTGGGFGGCVVALAPPALAERAIDAVASRYRSPDGRPATPYLCRAAAGAGPLALD
jgi:galactokinase